jgi:TolA-binding protein
VRLAPRVTLLATSLAASCVYSKAEGQRLESEVYALQTRTQATQAQLDAIHKEQEAQRGQISQLQEEVGDLNIAARRNDADFGVQLEEFLQKMASFEGRLESLDSRTSALESSLSKAQAEIDLKLEDLADNQENKASSAAAKKQDRLLSSPKEALAEVERLLSRGGSVEARKLLRELVLRKEGDAGYQRWAPKAQYLLGETYFAQKNYRQAAAEYNKVRKEHPRASVMPDALLKLGMCFERLGLKDDAKLFYETVTKSFSKSGAADTARTRLKAL